MKVVFTEPAAEDLRAIRTYIKSQYPDHLKPFEQRLSAVLLRIAMWPKSAYEVAERPGVRAVPLRRYPYKLFYTTAGQRVEILHVNHDKQRPWEGQ